MKDYRIRTWYCFQSAQEKSLLPCCWGISLLWQEEAAASNRNQEVRSSSQKVKEMLSSNLNRLRWRDGLTSRWKCSEGGCRSGAFWKRIAENTQPGAQWTLVNVWLALRDRCNRLRAENPVVKEQRFKNVPKLCWILHTQDKEKTRVRKVSS